MCGTDFTIGCDTAVSSALEAIDRIRDTAHSHERLFLVEVMRRPCPGITLHVGLAGGAEDVMPADDVRETGSRPRPAPLELRELARSIA